MGIISVVGFDPRQPFLGWFEEFGLHTSTSAAAMPLLRWGSCSRQLGKEAEVTAAEPCTCSVTGCGQSWIKLGTQMDLHPGVSREERGHHCRTGRDSLRDGSSSYTIS